MDVTCAVKANNPVKNSIAERRLDAAKGIKVRVVMEKTTRTEKTFLIRFVTTRCSEPLFQDQIQAVQSSPDHDRGVGTVPESAGKHGEQ